MRMALSEVAATLGGRLSGPDLSFDAVSTDSRTLRPGQLFVALIGPHFDGHRFLAEAAAAGAVGALIGRPAETPLATVTVYDTRIGLGQLAAQWRQRCAPKVCGITGSNGKTTVKEMVNAILASAGPTLCTQGNLNNDIGVPLTLLRLTGDECFAVIEMGANHRHEIGYVADIARPDVGLITNAGAAHLEGFGGFDGVAYGKGELIGSLGPAGTAVLNRDDKYFPLWRQFAGRRRVVSFGWDPAADVSAVADSVEANFQDNRFATRFDLRLGSQRLAVALGLAGRHNVLNAMAAAAAGLAMGVEPEHIRAGLAAVHPVKGRVQCVAAHDSIVVDDTYNANPSSMDAALAVLKDLPGDPWVVLGGFGELGDASPELHREVGLAIRAAGVQRLFAVGGDSEHAVAAFGDGGTHFSTQSALIDTLVAEWRPGIVALVKGSRAQRMELVVQALAAGAPPEVGHAA